MTKKIIDAPEDKFTEASVLSAMMNSNDVATRMAGTLRRDDFYEPMHRLIFDAVLNCINTKQEVSEVNIANILTKNNQLAAAGGRAGLGEIELLMPSAERLERDIRILCELSRRRMFIELLRNAAKEATNYTTTIEDIQGKLERALKDLPQPPESKIRFSPEVLLAMLSKLREYQDSTDKLLGIPSGFASLDDYLSGFRKKSLYILAGTTGSGKSALVTNMALYASGLGKKVLFYSLEMPSDQIAERMTFSMAQVPVHRGKSKKLSLDELQKITTAVDNISMRVIGFCDQGGTTVSDICHEVKQYPETDILIVDYLQLVKPLTRHQNREQEVAEISRTLKLLAMEMKIPVIALSQLNRNAEGRDDKKPKLTDIRESSAICNDANVVMMLHRELMENQTEAELFIRKNREGPMGAIKLRFVPEYTTFYDYNQN